MYFCRSIPEIVPVPCRNNGCWLTQTELSSYCTKRQLPKLLESLAGNLWSLKYKTTRLCLYFTHLDSSLYLLHPFAASAKQASGLFPPCFMHCLLNSKESLLVVHGDRLFPESIKGCVLWIIQSEMGSAEHMLFCVTEISYFKSETDQKKTSCVAENCTVRVKGTWTHRESDAHCGREGARDEFSLIELDQQRRFSHAAVPDQDCLQENTNKHTLRHQRPWGDTLTGYFLVYSSTFNETTCCCLVLLTGGLWLCAV